MSGSGPRLSLSAEAIRRGVFAELQARIERFTAGGGDLVPLQIGDTFLDPPEGARFPAVIDASTLEPDLYRYGATLGLATLRAAFAARLTARYGLSIDADRELLLGSGATHALYCAARAILDPGDDVLLASPYWPLAHGILASCGARVIEVPFTSRLYDEPDLDAAEPFRRALTPATKAIYFITPNNPDGKVLTRAQLERIAALAIERDLWVFADEAYADHAFDRAHVSLATLPGMAERTVTAHSLSKSHALAGVRLGCVVGPAAMIAAARKVAIHTTFNVPVIAQRSALAALQLGEAWPERARTHYREARDAAIEALHGAPVKFGRAEGGTYLFLDFAAPLQGRPLQVLLERAIDHGVLLAPGEAFGTDWSTHARLCYSAVPRPRLLEGITRLRAAVDSLDR